MNEKMIELLKNEEFCIRFFDALEDQAGLKALLEENGVALTDEQVQELVVVAKAQMAKADSGEMNEEDLDNVAGGIIGWVVAGVVCGIFFGYQVYKGRKAINEAVCR